MCESVEGKAQANCIFLFLSAGDHDAHGLGWRRGGGHNSPVPPSRFSVILYNYCGILHTRTHVKIGVTLGRGGGVNDLNSRNRALSF